MRSAIDGRMVRSVPGPVDAAGRLEFPAPRGNLTIKTAILNGPEGMGTVSVSENAAARVEIVLAQTAQRVSRK